MSNEDIVRIAEKAVDGKAFSTPRMSNRRRKSFEIILALALHIPEGEWPAPSRSTRRRPSREQTERFERLKTTRDKIAAELVSIPRLSLLEARLRPPPWMPILLFLCAGKRSFSSLKLPGVAFMPPDSDIIALALGGHRLRRRHL